MTERDEAADGEVLSSRPDAHTPAVADDVLPEIKQRRLNEIITLQTTHSLKRNERILGQVHEILIEGPSRRSDAHWQGRNSENKVFVFPKKENTNAGQIVHVVAETCNRATILGKIVETK